MIPTSIDGTDITGATIDGTDVQEITVDGDTVFTAGPDFPLVVDDFEDGNLNEYVGATSAFTVSSTEVFNGSNSLQRFDSTGTERIVSQSGLQNYPQQGQEFGWFIYVPAASTSSNIVSQISWAQQSTDGTNTDGYIAQIRPAQNKYVLGRGGSGLINNTTETSVTWSNFTDKFLEERITWDTDGSMTAEIYDGAKDAGASLIASLSFTDTTHSSGGIGFELRNLVYVDFYRIIGTI
jgi:hypothetical protein